MVRALAEAGGDVNKKRVGGVTALMYTAQRLGGTHAAGVMRALIDAGADVDAQDEDGDTALMLASENKGEHGKAMVRVLGDAYIAHATQRATKRRRVKR